jgi:hypothetical protein
MAAAAIRVAINLLNGTKIPQEISLPLEEIATGDVQIPGQRSGPLREFPRRRR